MPPIVPKLGERLLKNDLGARGDWFLTLVESQIFLELILKLELFKFTKFLIKEYLLDPYSIESLTEEFLTFHFSCLAKLTKL